MGIQTYSNSKVDIVGFRQELDESKTDILEIPVRLLFRVSVAFSCRYFLFWTLNFMRGFNPNSDYLSTNLRPKPPWTSQIRCSSSSD